ncbi:uncharacterized protein LOC116618594 isoform X2 [Nematostella vectensis]|nr:uncharacterized protein LOC116618594 isoform X2 [Nematostella vectensis]
MRGAFLDCLIAFYRPSRLLLVFLVSAVVFLLCRQHWKPLRDRTKRAQPVTVPELGCLYTVSPPKLTEGWKVFSIIVKPSPQGACKSRESRGIVAGGSTFRVQAFGSHEMVTGDVTHIGDDTYNATLRLTFDDSYIVMVILTYVNHESLEFRSHKNAVLQQVQNSPFELRVTMGTPPAGYTRYCTQEESGTSRGRWVECGKLAGIEECDAWVQDPLFDFDQIHGFHWVPYECQLHHYTDEEIKRCFAKNGWSDIAFTGDSHMRYRTYHWVTRLHGNCDGCIKTHIKMVFNKIPRIEWIFDARGTRWPITFPDIQLPNEVYVHPKTRRSMFSKELPSSVFDVKLFMMNFGHWVLRESTQEKFMISKLEAYAEAIKRMNTSKGQRRFLWVNTVSLPWRDDKAVVEWIENPSPSRVAQWNRLSDAVMRENGIQVVDAFQISNSRIGATHDQTHYAKRFARGDCGGVVENAISNTIANALCNFDI